MALCNFFQIFDYFASDFLRNYFLGFSQLKYSSLRSHNGNHLYAVKNGILGKDMCVGKLQHDAVDLQFCICSYNLLSKSTYRVRWSVIIFLFCKAPVGYFKKYSYLSSCSNFHLLCTLLRYTTTMMRIIASISYRVAWQSM